MAINILKERDASDIVKDFRNDYTNLKIFFKNFNPTIETKIASSRFSYPRSVESQKLFPHYGAFMGYFIRKLLANKYHIEVKDDRAELVLREKQVYFTANVRRCISPSEFEKHYRIFKESSSEAMDVIDSIKKVSLSTTIFFGDGLPRADVETDNKNLLEVKKYVESLPYLKVELCSEINCEYFQGHADIVFDKTVLYEIKNTKRNIDLKYFEKLILYAFGYYKKTGIKLKSLKIYNPLLGQEFTVKLDDFDMEHFEKVIKRDMEILEAKYS